MKYIITYKAKRKNAKRHIITTTKGTPEYYKTINDAERIAKILNKRYIVNIVDTKYNTIKEY